MHADSRRGQVGAWSLAVLACAALGGCLSAFAPAVKVRGPHAQVQARDTQADCLSCHELESQAMARLQARANGDPSVASNTDLHGAAHRASPAPLVADWMVDEAPSCLDCHALRGHPE